MKRLVCCRNFRLLRTWRPVPTSSVGIYLGDAFHSLVVALQRVCCLCMLPIDEKTAKKNVDAGCYQLVNDQVWVARDARLQDIIGPM